MADPAGVVLARDDGLIDVPGAIAAPAGLIQAVEQLLDTLLGPREQQQQTEET